MKKTPLNRITIAVAEGHQAAGIGDHLHAGKQEAGQEEAVETTAEENINN